MNDPKDDSSAKRCFDAIAVIRMMGRPPVSKAERLDNYEALLRMKVAAIGPVDVVECYHTRRAVDLIWEAFRYARTETALVDLTRKEALSRLLEEYGPDEIEGLELGELVGRWFTDYATRDRILDHWRRFGVDEDSVEALIVTMRAAELARIGEMRAKIEAQAMAHLREIERYRDMRSSGAPMLPPPDSEAA